MGAAGVSFHINQDILGQMRFLDVWNAVGLEIFKALNFAFGESLSKRIYVERARHNLKVFKRSKIQQMSLRFLLLPFSPRTGSKIFLH